MDISRVGVTRLRDGRWRLSFYASARRVYEERFNELDTALDLAPRIYRDRFGDDSKPGGEYYGKSV